MFLLEVRGDLEPKCPTALVSKEGSTVMLGAGALLYFKQTLRFTESQNVRGWKGPLWVI